MISEYLHRVQAGCLDDGFHKSRRRIRRQFVNMQLSFRINRKYLESLFFATVLKKIKLNCVYFHFIAGK